MIFISNEDELVFKTNKQVLYFYSMDYPFHSVAFKMLKALEKYNADFFAIDISFFTSLIKRFDIKNYPTIVFIGNGKEKKRLTELVSSKDLIKIMEKL